MTVTIANTYGACPHKLKESSRKRGHHTLQQNLKTSQEFAEERGEKVSEGTWSALECIVLSEICKDEKEDYQF